MVRIPKIRFLGSQGRFELKFTSIKGNTNKNNPNFIIDLFGRKGVVLKEKDGGSWSLGKLLQIKKE
jgi:hypothetical protein